MGFSRDFSRDSFSNSSKSSSKENYPGINLVFFPVVPVGFFGSSLMVSLGILQGFIDVLF